MIREIKCGVTCAYYSKSILRCEWNLHSSCIDNMSFSLNYTKGCNPDVYNIKVFASPCCFVLNNFSKRAQWLVLILQFSFLRNILETLQIYWRQHNRKFPQIQNLWLNWKTIIKIYDSTRLIDQFMMLFHLICSYENFLDILIWIFAV